MSISEFYIQYFSSPPIPIIVATQAGILNSKFAANYFTSPLNPMILLIVINVFLLILTLITVFNDPDHENKGVRMVIFIGWFGFVLLGQIASFFQYLIERSFSSIDYELLRIDNFLGLVFFVFILPFIGVVIFFFEGFATLMIRLKYLFLNKSPREVLMERTQKKEGQAREKEYEAKKEEIKEKEVAVQEKLSALRKDLPEVVDALPRDIVDYQGYFREVEKRFQERQLTKTTKLARERLEEVRRLCEEGARLQRARVDLEVAKFEFANVDKAVELKKKEMILKDKGLDRDILQAKADISSLKKMFSRKKKREDFEL